MSLYDEVLKISKEYTGIAAEEFLRRRCMSLGLSQPQELQSSHIDRLIQGISVTAGAYMSDARLKSFTDEIAKLKAPN